MGQMTRVVHGDTTYAILIESFGGQAPGFFTPRETALQAGIVDHPAGYYSPPHAHSCERREIGETCEFLYVDSGRIAVEIFDEAWRSLRAVTLAAGDCAVLIRGGHSVRALEPTRLVEVKQGPYPGDGKAKVFRDAQ